MDILDAIDAAVGCQECGGSLDGSPSDDFCGDGCQQAWHAARAVELVGYREPRDRPDDFPPGVIPPEAFEDDEPALRLVPMRSADAIRLAEQFAAGLAEGIRAPAAPSVNPWLGVLQVSWDPRPPEFRLPRSTGDLRADWRALRRARLAARTPAEHAAVQLRIDSLLERDRAVAAAFMGRNFVREQEHRAALLAFAAQVSATWNQVCRSAQAAFLHVGEALAPFAEQLRRAGVVDAPPPADPWERALAARRNRNTGPQQQRRPPRSIGRAASSGRR